MVSIIKDVIAKRSLIYQLVLKDLKIRYLRPLLGFFWAFLSPFLVVVIFYIVFSMILKVKTEEAPFLLYLMSAVFSWRFFQDSLLSATTSLVDNKNLIKESSFSHYLIPISIVLANAINFFPSLVIVVVTSLFVLKGLPIYILFLPIVLGIHLSLAIGLSIILSIAYVKWRDIKYILEAVLLFLFYLTPVFYSIKLVKDSFSPFLFSAYIYNPLVGILNLYRATILKDFFIYIEKYVSLSSLIIVPAGFAIAILVLGFYFYKKNKNSINDYLSY
jgi:ABC-2 type transport system permease protein